MELYDKSKFWLKVFVFVLRTPVVGEVLWLFGFPQGLALKNRKVNFTLHDSSLDTYWFYWAEVEDTGGGFVFLFIFPTSSWRALRDMGCKKNKFAKRRKKSEK